VSTNSRKVKTVDELLAGMLGDETRNTAPIKSNEQFRLLCLIREQCSKNGMCNMTNGQLGRALGIEESEIRPLLAQLKSRELIEASDFGHNKGACDQFQIDLSISPIAYDEEELKPKKNYDIEYLVRKHSGPKGVTENMANVRDLPKVSLRCATVAMVIHAMQREGQNKGTISDIADVMGISESELQQPLRDLVNTNTARNANGLYKPGHQSSVKIAGTNDLRLPKGVEALNGILNLPNASRTANLNIIREHLSEQRGEISSTNAPVVADVTAQPPAPIELTDREEPEEPSENLADRAAPAVMPQGDTDTMNTLNADNNALSNGPKPTHKTAKTGASPFIYERLGDEQFWAKFQNEEHSISRPSMIKELLSELHQQGIQCSKSTMGTTIDKLTRLGVFSVKRVGKLSFLTKEDLTKIPTSRHEKNGTESPSHDTRKDQTHDGSTLPTPNANLPRDEEDGDTPQEPVLPNTAPHTSVGIKQPTASPVLPEPTPASPSRGGTESLDFLEALAMVGAAGNYLVSETRAIFQLTNATSAGFALDKLIEQEKALMGEIVQKVSDLARIRSLQDLLHKDGLDKIYDSVAKKGE